MRMMGLEKNTFRRDVQLFPHLEKKLTIRAGEKMEKDPPIVGPTIYMAKELKMEKDPP